LGRTDKGFKTSSYPTICLADLAECLSSVTDGRWSRLCEEDERQHLTQRPTVIDYRLCYRFLVISNIDIVCVDCILLNTSLFFPRSSWNIKETPKTTSILYYVCLWFSVIHWACLLLNLGPSWC